MVGYTWLRWRPGLVTSLRDRHLGRWAAGELQSLRPDACYMFTQVALESLRWCRRESIPTVLDNPNGHIRNFQQVCEKEARRWFGTRFHGSPTPETVERVSLTDRITAMALERYNAREESLGTIFFAGLDFRLGDSIGIKRDARMLAECYFCLREFAG